ncbi:MAG: nuclear transport factor 2 family protein, partial [Terriglobia bacterium]
MASTAARIGYNARAALERLSCCFARIMRNADHQHDEQEVLAANEAFYRAVEALDLKQMGAAWWHDDWVLCLHPGWPLVRGWEG